MKGTGSIIFTCEWCGEQFKGSPFRTKYKHNFCSKECSASFRKQATIEKREKEKIVCPVCGKKFWAHPWRIENHETVCCSKECDKEIRRIKMAGENNHQFGIKGSKNASWVSDEKISSNRYKLVRRLDHPFRNQDDFVYEHRLVAEEFLLNEENSVTVNGIKYLSPEYVVHHKDFNPLNNIPENLEVMTNAKHTALHDKLKWYFVGTNKVTKPKEENMDKILVRRVDSEAKMPTKAHEYDAGWDLYSLKDYEIKPHETVKIDTGLNFRLPMNTFGGIYARSGLATNQGIRPANCVGVCDCQYNGNYIVPLYNDSNETRYIKKHDRVAQLIIHPIIDTNLIEVDNLSETDRGEGGFGSTGTN